MFYVNTVLCVKIIILIFTSGLYGAMHLSYRKDFRILIINVIFICDFGFFVSVFYY